MFLESFDLSMDAQSRSRLETHQLHHHLRIQGEEALPIHLLGGEGGKEGGMRREEGREGGREGEREGRREGGRERGRKGENE